MKPRTPRNPQLALQLDAGIPDPAARWRDGASFTYLGDTLQLTIDADRKAAMRVGKTLHLPLPPAASPRQIQDGVEAWLRQEAACLIGLQVDAQASRLSRSSPPWALSFASRGGWSQHHADGSLRFNWRLVEQPVAVIEQVVRHAVATLPLPVVSDDLWGMQAA